jgi:hypothetical protein
MMHRKITTAVVARPAETVFAQVTTAGWWPRVSPITLRIEGVDSERPLARGETFREHVRIAGWHGTIDWMVDILEPASRCVLHGVARGEGLVGLLTGQDAVSLDIAVTREEEATRLTRQLSYHVGIVEAIGDLLGFAKAFDTAADVTMATMVSTLENLLLWGERPDAAAESLFHEADPLGDEAVASLVAPNGDCTGLERFIGSLYHGEPALDDLPAPMRAYFEATVDIPAWSCVSRIDAASEVFLDWGVLAVGAHICASLPETYALPRTAKLLNLTRELDADPTHTDRRLWFTVRMCLDVLCENGLSPRGEGRLALQRLRLIHSMVRLFVERRLDTPHRLAGLSSSALWDSANGRPISQLELLHTLLTFSHVVLRSLDILGASLTPYQRESYIHIWNVAGAQLGIRPEVLPRDADDAARMFESIKTRYAARSDEAIELGRALVWFWTSLFPDAVRNEARELMQFVIAELLAPETASINGFDALPAFSPTAARAVKGCLEVSSRLCSAAYDHIPGARQAVALVVSLLMRGRTHTFEDQSGTFDVPQQLYERWRSVPATVQTDGGLR